MKDKATKMLKEFLYDESNCVSIEEAREEVEKKWPREKESLEK